MLWRPEWGMHERAISGPLYVWDPAKRRGPCLPRSGGPPAEHQGALQHPQAPIISRRHTPFTTSSTFSTCHTSFTASTQLMPTCIPPCLPYIDAYMPTRAHTRLHVSMPSVLPCLLYLHAYMPHVRIHAFHAFHTSMPTRWYTYLHASTPSMPTCLHPHAGIRACTSLCLPYLHSHMPTRRHTRLHSSYLLYLYASMPTPRHARLHAPMPSIPPRLHTHASPCSYMPLRLPYLDMYMPTRRHTRQHASMSTYHMSACPPACLHTFHTSMRLHALTWPYAFHTSMPTCPHVAIHACTPLCLHTTRRHALLHASIPSMLLCLHAHTFPYLPYLHAMSPRTPGRLHAQDTAYALHSSHNIIVYGILSIWTAYKHIYMCTSLCAALQRWACGLMVFL